MKSFKTWCPKCFKALSTGVRAKIVGLLEGQAEKSVTEIVKEFRLSQPTISYHLSELEKVGLLKSRSQGRHVYYRQNILCPYDNKKCILR